MFENQDGEVVLYQEESDYPAIEVVSPNEYYASLLFEDYAGSNGEMTSFAQYEYHYMDHCHYDYRIARHLRNIASVERRHMEILGELICLLGGFPVYRSNLYHENSYWNAKRIDYGRNIEEQLKLDLEKEYRCICNYNIHIKLIDDPYIKQMLERIVKDEYVHTTVLQTLIRGDC